MTDLMKYNNNHHEEKIKLNGNSNLNERTP